MIKERIDLHKLIKLRTPEEIQLANKRSEYRRYLGIVDYFDVATTCNENKIKLTYYSRYSDYMNDMNIADYYIYNNQQVPKDLEKKLVETKLEIEGFKGL